MAMQQPYEKKKNSVLSHPIQSWKEARNSRKQQAIERAAQEITESIAKNESKMIDALFAIDYANSNLPEEVLEKKTVETQNCGDLQYVTERIGRDLQTKPLISRVDINEIDKRLLALIYLMQEAVNQGNANMANAAKGALIRGFVNIRGKVSDIRPDVKPEFTKLYVESSVKYLDEWITYIATAKTVDETESNLNVQKRKLEQAQAEVDMQKDALEAISKEEFSEDALALYQISHNDAPADRAKWTDAQTAMHKRLIQLAYDESILSLRKKQVELKDINLMGSKNTLEMLYSKLSLVPIVTDPNLVNKQNEIIDELIRDLAATDVAIDEQLHKMEEIDGMLKQLDNASGTVKAKELAAKEGRRVLSEIEDNEAKNSAVDKALLEKYRIEHDEHIRLKKIEQTDFLAQIEQEKEELKETIPEIELEELPLEEETETVAELELDLN